MGAIISRQPNGLLCRFSTIVANFTHINMTDEEYIEMCAEQAREEARMLLESKHFYYPFEDIAKEQIFGNGTRKQILATYRKMGDNKIQLKDIDVYGDFAEEDEE